MTTQFEQFRNDIYEWFPFRADALMDLLDALSGNANARSVIELCLNFLFRRQYGSIPDGIENLFVPENAENRFVERQEFEQDLVRLLVPYLPTPQRPYRLLVTDVTSAPRPFSPTLSDRTFVYKPNAVKGVKPITIGHQYSVTGILPEKNDPDAPPWMIPLLVNRVVSQETKRESGLSQINRLMTDENLPFGKELCVNVVDSDYSSVPYLSRVVNHPNLVTVARLPGHRTVYGLPVPLPADDPNPQGHPTWFGKPFSLRNADSWGKPDVEEHTAYMTRKGKHYSVKLQEWSERLMRGKKGIPMHEYPFRLVRITMFNSDMEPVFDRPLWLVVFGTRRNELSLLDIWNAYRQRYDIEHFFRFGKQRLLMGEYQTPVTEHEENWWTITQLAYLQLWMAREHATILPRPWERYLPKFCSDDSKPPIVSPSDVQRDLPRIIRQIGTPARIPKPRGKSPGRAPGQSPGIRPHLPVIKKSARAS